MKYLIIAFAVLVAVFIATDTVSASGDCYGFGASGRSTSLTTQSKLAQQYTQDEPGLIESVSMNIYILSGSPAPSGLFHFAIQETTAGLPNGTVVPGSTVQKAVADVGYAAVGAESAFICGNRKVSQTFTFGAPISLTPGQMYALVMYATSGTGQRVLAWVDGFPSLAPLDGLVCTGAPCTTDTGWAVSDFGGQNYDQVFDVETDIVDATNTDGKIDSHIDNLRVYMRLDSTDGGLIFGIGVVGIIFAIGLLSRVPFMVVAFFNLMLVGSFSVAQIMPPWILIAVVMVAGIAVMLKILSGGSKGSGSDEV